MEEKIIEAHLILNTITSNSKKAYSEHNQFSFGEKIEDKIKYSLPETMFLIQNGKMKLYSNKKIISPEETMKKFAKLDKKFLTKYAVFKDLRTKGYIVKTALKFGAEFRVYEKEKKIGKSHAKWIVFTDVETNKTSWHDFSAKMRVAHSTKKNLLLAIVDDEDQILYYEVNWVKP
jgi:tRNA-intron endonuclease, archaea type